MLSGLKFKIVYSLEKELEKVSLLEGLYVDIGFWSLGRND